jgi:methyl-accepting chemotaxis protein
MDEVTQQNSALVEENAATAKTLEQQSIAMDERVGFFRFEDSADDEAIAAGRGSASPTHGRRPAVVDMTAQRPPMRPVARQNNAQVARTRTALAAAIKEAPDWQEF